MAKYFLDTEFKEKPNTIDLISIGIVCEDGRKYYALNKNFNLKEAWKDDWFRENVLLPIYTEYVHGDMRNHFSFSIKTMKGILKGYGKDINKISEEIKEFVYYTGWEIDPPVHSYKLNNKGNIEFYGYYSDYDWVVFCWIFGRMIDLPKGFPMYCKDLKQIMDDKGLDKDWKRKNCPDPKGEHNALIDAEWNMKLYNKIIKAKNK